MFETSFLINITPFDELIIEDDKVKTLKKRDSKSSRELIVLVRSSKVSISRYFSLRFLFLSSN